MNFIQLIDLMNNFFSDLKSEYCCEYYYEIVQQVSLK